MQGSARALKKKKAVTSGGQYLSALQQFGSAAAAQQSLAQCSALVSSLSHRAQT